MSTRSLVFFLVGLAAPSALGCSAPIGSSTLSVPKDGATECASQCAVMGLRLSAVAIMANHVGCVCQPPPAQVQSEGEKAVMPAGMATLMFLEELERQLNDSQQAPAARSASRWLTPANPNSP